MILPAGRLFHLRWSAPEAAPAIAAGLSFAVAAALLRFPVPTLALIVAAAACLAAARRPAVLALGYIAALPLLQTFAIRWQLVGGGVGMSLNLMGAFNLFLLGAGTWSLWLHRDRVAWRRLWPVPALVGYLLITVVYSPEPLLSLRNWLSYAVPAVIALLLSTEWAEAELWRKGFLALAICGAVSTLLGGLQLLNWDLSYSFNGIPRIWGGHGHPNMFAMFLVICILCALLLATRPLPGGTRVALFVSLGVLFTLLFFTFSRSGWIVLAVTLLGGAFLLRRFAVGIFVLAVLGAGLLFTEMIPMMVERFQPDNAYYIRFTLIRLGWSLFLDAPVFGHGVGTFQLLSRHALGTVVERHDIRLGLSPHNDTIRFLVEGGLLGLVLYGALLLRLGRIGWDLFRRREDPEGSLGVFLLMVVGGTAVFGLGGQGFAHSSSYLLAAAGIGAAYLGGNGGGVGHGRRGRPGSGEQVQCQPSADQGEVLRSDQSRSSRQK